MTKWFFVMSLLVPSYLYAQQAPTPLSTVQLPAADPNITYGGNANPFYGPTGNLYATTGSAVLEQQGSSFAQIGTVPTNGSDPGPATFSSSGQSILISDGGGGLNPNTNLYEMPANGGTATLVGNTGSNLAYYATPTPSTKYDSYFIDSGTTTGSEVDLFNAGTGSFSPLITGIPGASSTLDYLNGELYVGVGYGPDQGELESFNVKLLFQQWKLGTPESWAEGSLINPPDQSNSGAGIIVEPNGDIFVGGPYGIEVIDPQGSTVYGVPYDASGDDLTYVYLTYNQADNQFMATGYDDTSSFAVSTGYIFSPSQFESVPEPSGLWIILIAIVALFFMRK